MMKISSALLASLFLISPYVLAQPAAGVTESTDPARAAAVERQAQEIQSRRQQADTSGQAAGSTGATSEMSGTQNAPVERKHKRKHKKIHKAHKSTAPTGTSGSSNSNNTNSETGTAPAGSGNMTEPR